MKGLIIKDILNLKKTLRATLLTLILFAIFAYSTGDPGYIIGMVVMIFTMMSVTSMSYDEAIKWDRYALSMPISRKDMVVSKYILSTLLSMISIAISTTIAYFLILPKSQMSGLDLLLTSYIMFGSSILFISAMLPLIYKFGVEKMRLFMVVIVGIPVAIVVFLTKMGMAKPDEEQMMMLLKLSPLILLIGLVISMSISCIIYENKEI